MTYGVDATGFLKKTLAEIISEIEADERSAISPTLNLLASTVVGQLNGIFGDKLRELWDVAQAVYRAMYPDSASGEALDQVCSITGCTRLPATRSLVTLDGLQLDAGTVVPVGSIVSVGTTGAHFRLTQQVTNATAAPGTFSGTAESVDTGPIQGLAQTIDTIVTPIAGWSAAAALTCANAQTYALVDHQTLTVKVDGGAVQTVTFLTGQFADIAHATAAEVAAVIDGALTGGGAVAALTKVRIFSDLEGSGSSVQVTGGAANAALGFDTDLVKGFHSTDAAVGRNIETDAELRVRRVELLRVTGGGSVEAIRARVRDVDDVIQAFVFENTTMAVDGNGLPPKSFEVVVAGGLDQAIADTIWRAKPAGMESYGTTSRTVTDSMGFTHTIWYSRPTEVPIYIELTVTTDPLVFPVDGETQIKAALKAFGEAMQIGDDIYALQFKCVPLSVAGVVDVTVFKIDIVDPPMNTGKLVIAFRALATFDTGDIDVTVV